MYKNSERSKQWRNKRKNDPVFLQNERQRKQLSRKNRTEEQKKRDRELCKARQHRYRNRKRKLLLEKSEDSVEEQMSDNSDVYGSTSCGESMDTDSVNSVTRSQDLVRSEYDVNGSSTTNGESFEMSRCLPISVEDEQFVDLKAGPVLKSGHDYQTVDNGDDSNNTDVHTSITGNGRNRPYDEFTKAMHSRGNLRYDSEADSKQDSCDVVNKTGFNSLTLPAGTPNNDSKDEKENKLFVGSGSGSNAGFSIFGSMKDNAEQPCVCPSNTGKIKKIKCLSEHESTSELHADDDISISGNDSVSTEEVCTGSERLVLLTKTNNHSSMIGKKTTKWIQQYSEGEDHEVKSFLTNDVTFTAAPQRQAFFMRLQNELSQVTDFDDLKSMCGEVYSEIEELYPMPVVSTLSDVGHLRDVIAGSLYPPDAPSDHVPVRIVGDGNCLPRVGSLFAFGNDKRHIEIRVRIFIELCLFEDTYLNDSYLNRGLDNTSVTKRTAALIAQYCDVFPRDTQGQDRYQYIYRVNTRTVLKPGSYNGMWSIYALASVIGVTIRSIYPDYGGHNVRDDHNRMILPRVSRNTDTIIHIMWTNTKGRQPRASVWTPNHFVAVLHESKIKNLSLGTTMGSSAGKNSITPTTSTGTRASDEERNEDTCVVHASEKLVYLCGTCNGRPICYKCHLEEHKNHEYEDLKVHLDKKENEYLLKALQKHVTVLGNEIKRQQMENKRNIARIAAEIDARVSHISDTLQKWRQQCRQKLQEDGQAINNNIALSGTRVWTTQISNHIGTLKKRLRNLHTTERLASISEGPPEVTLNIDACACIQFTPGNDEQMIQQFGGLSCTLPGARDSAQDITNTPMDTHDYSVNKSVDKFRQSGLLINPSNHVTHTPDTHKDEAMTSLSLASCSESSVVDQKEQKGRPDTQTKGSLKAPTPNKRPRIVPIVTTDVESGKKLFLTSGTSGFNDEVPIISPPKDQEKKTGMHDSCISPNTALTKTRSVPNMVDNTEIIKLLKRPNMEVSTNPAPPYTEMTPNLLCTQPSGMALPVRHFSKQATSCNEVGSPCRQQVYTSPVSSESSVNQSSFKSNAYIIKTSQTLITAQTVCIGEDTAQPVCPGKDSTQNVCTGKDPTQIVCTGKDPTQNVCTGKDPTQIACTGVDTTQTVCTGVDTTQTVCPGKEAAQTVGSGDDPTQIACTGVDTTQIACTGVDTTQTVCTGVDTTQTVCPGKEAAQTVGTGDDPTQIACTGVDTTQTVCSADPIPTVCTGKDPTQTVCTGGHSTQSVCTGDDSTQNICTGDDSTQNVFTGGNTIPTVCTGEDTIPTVCTGDDSTQSVCTGGDKIPTVCTGDHSTQSVCIAVDTSQKVSPG